MQVGVDDLVGTGLESIDATNRDVLLQGREHRLDVVLEVHDRLVAVGHHARRDLVGERHELLGLRHEVGLAAQLDDGGDVAVTHDGNGTFARFTVGALRGRGESLDAQPLD